MLCAEDISDGKRNFSCSQEIKPVCYLAAVGLYQYSIFVLIFPNKLPLTEFSMQ